MCLQVPLCLLCSSVPAESARVFAGLTGHRVRLRSQLQRQLLQEVYSEAAVHPSQVTYVEAHGTGTKVRITRVITCVDGAHSQPCRREDAGEQ